MPKGVSDAGEAPTAAAALREALGRLEAGLGALRGAGAAAALELLRQRDRAAEEMAQLAGLGADLRPERARLEHIDSMLRGRASALLRGLGGSAGLAAAREGAVAESWWWRLDESVATQRRRRWARAVGGILLAAAVLAGAGWWADARWGLLPEERDYERQVMAGQQALEAGDAGAALAAYEAAASMRPEVAEVQAMVGVLAGAAGRSDAAERALAAARAASGDEGAYQVLLARSYQQAGLAECGLAAARAAIAASTSRVTQAEAYLVRGGIEEGLGDSWAALADYDQAGALAAAAGLTELEAMARARYALLMQRGPGLATAPTP